MCASILLYFKIWLTWESAVSLKTFLFYHNVYLLKHNTKSKQKLMFNTDIIYKFLYIFIFYIYWIILYWCVKIICQVSITSKCSSATGHHSTDLVDKNIHWCLYLKIRFWNACLLILPLVIEPPTILAEFF